MRRIWALSVLLFLSVSLTSRALDLTPLKGARELEGAKIPVLFFHDGARVVRYQPPGGWAARGTEAELQFTLPSETDASVKWRILKRKPENLGNETPETLAKWAQTAIPQGAEEIALTATNPSPYTLNAHPSLEFVFTYVVGGRRFKKSVSICDLSPSERLLIQVTGNAQNFASIRDAAISSLFSWMPE